MSLRGDARYRLAEMRGLLIEAGRAQLLPDPGIATVVTGPLRWLARALRGQGDAEQRAAVRPLGRSR
jgi:hypothetical protein